MRTDWHALEFTRTRGWEARDRSDDEIAGFEELFEWCGRHDIVPASLARHFRSCAGQCPSQARTALRSGHALRQMIYRVLSHAAGGKPLTHEQLRHVNAWLDPTMCAAVLGNVSIR